MRSWVLLTYQVPREPSASRVFVWRRLRRLGAIQVQGSVWALPRSDFTQEQYQWLASEIKQLGGEAIVWIAQPFPGSADEELVREFARSADAEFAAIASAARRGRRSPATLSREFQDACRRDFFGSPRRAAARAALLSLSGRRDRAPAKRRPVGRRTAP